MTPPLFASIIMWTNRIWLHFHSFSCKFQIFQSRSQRYYQPCLPLLNIKLSSKIGMLENLNWWYIQVSTPIYPIGLELGVETTFPLPEGTSTGLIVQIGYDLILNEHQKHFICCLGNYRESFGYGCWHSFVARQRMKRGQFKFAQNQAIKAPLDSSIGDVCVQ